MEKKIPTYNLDIEDLDFDSINAMSVVYDPAVESMFLKFNKSEKVKLQTLNEGVLTGIALRADFDIYRVGQNGDEFNVNFTKDAVRRIAKYFFKNHNHDNTTVEHSFNANNMFIFESWLVVDSNQDKASKLGLEVSEGDWCISMDISGNQEVMDMVDNGELRGFSLEGYFSRMLIDSSKHNKQIEDYTNEELDVLFEEIKDVFKQKK